MRIVKCIRLALSENQPKKIQMEVKPGKWLYVTGVDRSGVRTSPYAHTALTQEELDQCKRMKPGARFKLVS